MSSCENVSRVSSSTRSLCRMPEVSGMFRMSCLSDMSCSTESLSTTANLCHVSNMSCLRRVPCVACTAKMSDCKTDCRLGHATVLYVHAVYVSDRIQV